MQRGQDCLQNRLARTGFIGLISKRVLGATPGHPPASYHLSHTPPPIPKGRRGFCFSPAFAAIPSGAARRTRSPSPERTGAQDPFGPRLSHVDEWRRHQPARLQSPAGAPAPYRQRLANCVCFFGITGLSRCYGLRCWNLSSSNAAATFAGKCVIRPGKWSRPEGRGLVRPPVIAPIVRCSWYYPPAGRRPTSNRPDRGWHGSRDCRQVGVPPLAAPANPDELAGLDPATRTDRCPP